MAPKPPPKASFTDRIRVRIAHAIIFKLGVPLFGAERMHKELTEWEPDK